MFHQTLASSNMLSQRVQRGDCYIRSLTLYSDGADGQRFAALFAPGGAVCSTTVTSTGILTEYRNLSKCQIKGRLLTRSFEAHANICVSATWTLWKNLWLSRRLHSLVNTFDATSSVPHLNVTEERPTCVYLQIHDTIVALSYVSRQMRTLEYPLKKLYMALTTHPTVHPPCAKSTGINFRVAETDFLDRHASGGINKI